MKRGRLGRRLAATGILAAWVGALSWQGVRQSRLAADVVAGLGPRRIAPGASFYSVELGGRLLGMAGLTVDTSTTGYSLLELLRLDLPAASGPARHVLRGESRLSRTFRVRTAIFNLSEAGSLVQLNARLVEDTLLLLTGNRPGDRSSTLSAARTDEAVLSGSIPLRLAMSRGLEEGSSSVLPALDLLTGKLGPHTVQALAESTFVVPDSAERLPDGSWHIAGWDTVPARLVERRFERGSTMLWIDRDGRPVQWQHAFGPLFRRDVFELINARLREHETEARPAGSGRGPAGASRFAGPMGGGTRAESTVVVVGRRDGPVWPGAVAMFAGGRQRVAGDTVVIGGRGVERPDPEMLRVRYAPNRLEDHTLLVQAREQALEAYAPLGDTVSALARLVARDVRLDTMRTAPVMPVEVVRAARGNPEGKARLLAALARGAGIPARVVSGVVVDDPALRGYTWVEVFRDGAWETIDPLSGRMPASTSLLRVAEGAARPLALVPLIGALETTLVTPSVGAGRR